MHKKCQIKKNKLSASLNLRSVDRESRVLPSVPRPLDYRQTLPTNKIENRCYESLKAAADQNYSRSTTKLAFLLATLLWKKDSYNKPTLTCLLLIKRRKQRHISPLFWFYMDRNVKPFSDFVINVNEKFARKKIYIIESAIRYGNIKRISNTLNLIISLPSIVLTLGAPSLSRAISRQNSTNRVTAIQHLAPLVLLEAVRRNERRDEKRKNITLCIQMYSPSTIDFSCSIAFTICGRSEVRLHVKN